MLIKNVPLMLYKNRHIGTMMLSSHVTLAFDLLDSRSSLYKGISRASCLPILVTQSSIRFDLSRGNTVTWLQTNACYYSYVRTSVLQNIN